MSEWVFWSIADLAASLKARQISPVEVTAAALERTERLEPKLNTYVTVMREQAMTAAREAEAELTRGLWRGPLHGVPFGIKDLFDVVGAPNTFGSRILRENIPDRDALVVERLKRGGAVITGKQLLQEFAFGITSNNAHYGPVRNPWNQDCIPGGSSGGTGASVAAGTTYAGLGSDTGGSIRIPASLCGVVGFKPTYDLLPRDGALPLAWSLDHVGPLARTVMDAAICMDVLADAPGAYTAALGDAPRQNLRLGIPREYFWDHLDPEVRNATQRAIQHLESLGCAVREVSIPMASYSQAILSPIISSEAASWHEPWLKERPEDYGEEVLTRLQLGAAYPATVYLKAQRLRAVLRDQFAEALRDVDVLVTPTVPAPAARIGESMVQVGETEMETRACFNRLTCPSNLTGFPAVSVPCGHSSTGLPLGLQFIGGAGNDRTVLQAAYAFEQSTDHHTKRPVF